MRSSKIFQNSAMRASSDASAPAAFTAESATSTRLIVTTPWLKRP